MHCGSGLDHALNGDTVDWPLVRRHYVAVLEGESTYVWVRVPPFAWFDGTGRKAVGMVAQIKHRLLGRCAAAVAAAIRRTVSLPAPLPVPVVLALALALALALILLLCELL